MLVEKLQWTQESGKISENNTTGRKDSEISYSFQNSSPDALQCFFSKGDFDDSYILDCLVLNRFTLRATVFLTFLGTYRINVTQANNKQTNHCLFRSDFEWNSVGNLVKSKGVSQAFVLPTPSFLEASFSSLHYLLQVFRSPDS